MLGVFASSSLLRILDFTHFKARRIDRFTKYVFNTTLGTARLLYYHNYGKLTNLME